MLAESVIRRLDNARQKWWFFSLLTTSVLAVCGSLGLLLIFLLGDSWIRFSPGLLAGLFFTWLAVTGCFLWIVARRLVRNPRSLEAAARRVEAEFPELGNSVINLVQLSEDRSNGNRVFCESAVQHAAAQIGHVPFHAAARRVSRWQRLRYCLQTPRDLAESLVVLGGLFAAAVLCNALISNWGSAASRLFSPLQFIPSIGEVGEIAVQPGSTEILVGDSVPVRATITNPDKTHYKARLFLRSEGEAESSWPMTGDKNHRRYTLTIPSVRKPLAYRLEIGDSQTPVFHVAVREKPTVEEAAVTYRFPRYLGRPAETVIQKTADLQAPQYTEAELNIRPSTPIDRGHVEIDGMQIGGRVEDRGNRLAVRLLMLENTSFTVHLFLTNHLTDDAPRVNRLQVTADRPPRVEILKPARQITAVPGSEVPVMLRAADDHALGRLRLEMKIQSSTTETATPPSSPGKIATTAAQWTDLKNNNTVVRRHRLALEPEDVHAGQTVLIRAVAWDKRFLSQGALERRPQQSASGWHTIRIISEDAKNSALLAQIENLRSALWTILQKQIRARVAAAGILKIDQLARRTTAAGQLRAEQIEIQKSTLELARSIRQPEREEMQILKRVINGLATGAMLRAVEQGDALGRLKTQEAFPSPVAALTATQDEIIATLRKLLDVTRTLLEESLAEQKKRQGGDLPEDVRQQLESARNKLEEFLEQQKKVVEATDNLTKMPVEDFSEEEEQKLAALAAAEDDWAKFLKELHSDLSKLPEQDFANPSLLEELVEIQTELKMAKDALLKKSVDIAVPLEQLAYERAEELKTNLEKWLPDTPDREKWSQEESLTDQDKEAPMAELPGELEDLVGELMEQQEDLFDEMEDVSSSAADSLDAGAGWDAKDGPISNMSAKGVTGNRLPNTSEIGGRSGEGRQGKSSGEMVGDEAVGKGGRNTPSRLTPDPYMKGQIKDHSKDPTGGATGGGKESGQGGEGLEGPGHRPHGPRDLDRLAGRQAALRNQAEGIDLQFQVASFHHADLKKMIAVMAQIERDLKAGRYQNALRQRPVLAEGLGSVKQYLEGEYHLRQDTTSNLPAEIQKEILGSAQDPSPSGWEELNRQYFERLSQGDKEAKTKQPAK